MTILHIHVEDESGFWCRATAAARSIAVDNSAVDSHISFETAADFLRLLTPNRWSLLRALRQGGPSSIRALAAAVGKDYRGVHADVTALLDAELVRRDANGRMVVPWSRIVADMALHDAA